MSQVAGFELSVNELPAFNFDLVKSKALVLSHRLPATPGRRVMLDVAEESRRKMQSVVDVNSSEMVIIKTL